MYRPEQAAACCQIKRPLRDSRSRQDSDGRLFVASRARDNPEHIRWIIPRDAWLLNRANVQPGQGFFLQSFGSQARQFEAVGTAKSLSDLFARLEASQELLRLDPIVRPTAYHCAVMSKDELVEL